jgi:hypothetical protein
MQSHAVCARQLSIQGSGFPFFKEIAQINPKKPQIHGYCTEFEPKRGLIDGNYVGKMKGPRALSATFRNSNVTTNIGYLHEKGHPEPWIIAMDDDKYKGPTRHAGE